MHLPFISLDLILWFCASVTIKNEVGFSISLEYANFHPFFFYLKCLKKFCFEKGNSEGEILLYVDCMWLCPFCLIFPQRQLRNVRIPQTLTYVYISLFDQQQKIEFPPLTGLCKQMCLSQENARFPLLSFLCTVITGIFQNFRRVINNRKRNSLAFIFPVYF